MSSEPPFPILLRMLCEQLPAVVWTTDTQLVFTLSEGTALRDLGLQRGQVVGQTLFDYLGIQDEQYAPIAAHRRALSGFSESLDHDWMGRTWHVHIEPLRDEHQSVIGTIGVALDISDRRRMQASLAAAEEVQRSLYPESAPALPGFDLAGAAFPADETAGDYFDFLPMAGGRLGVVVGDVSGHGLPAALLMISLRGYLRSLAGLNVPVGEMLGSANRFLAADIRDYRYVTLFLARIDPQTRSMVYAGAGHCGYLFKESGGMEKLPSTGFPLGLVCDATIDTSRARDLQPGDLILLLTDGFEEALSPDRTLWGLPQVLATVETHRDRPAAEIVQTLWDGAEQFAAGVPQRDDMTAVVVKVGDG